MQIKGVNLNVRVTGSGTPFLWAHGLMSNIDAEDGQDFFGFISFLPNIQLVRYDARGHGKSQSFNRSLDYHFQNFSEDMLALADSLGAEQFIAGGISLGAATTLYAALQAHERIKALVLVSPGTAWETRPRQAQIYRGIALIGRFFGGRGLASIAGRRARLLPAWLAEAEPDTVAGLRQGLSSFSRKTLWNLMRGIAASDLPPRHRIKELVDIPAIILAWVDDPTHPVSTAQELHKLLPKAEYFVAQDYEDYRTIPRRIRDFVSRHT